MVKRLYKKIMVLINFFLFQVIIYLFILLPVFQDNRAWNFRNISSSKYADQQLQDSHCFWVFPRHLCRSEAEIFTAHLSMKKQVFKYWFWNTDNECQLLWAGRRKSQLEKVRCRGSHTQIRSRRKGILQNDLSFRISLPSLLS